MLSQIPQPLPYAESLLGHYGSLGGVSDENSLLAGLLQSTQQLSGCELSQLYLLDHSHTALQRVAEQLDTQFRCADITHLDDFSGESLLQYSLSQNRILFLEELDSHLYPSNCLPDSPVPWHSLLCLPIGEAQRVSGVMLLASRSGRDLQPFARSLQELGRFSLHQLRLHRRLHNTSALVSQATDNQALSKNYGLIGQSRSMQEVYRLIGKVLHSNLTVLVQGETGTGKELVARAIHDYGQRRTRPFIVQNCAALPEHLLESELFGYRRGAFTGADRDKIGLFDMADGGTLFLDEIGDFPLALQAKLLRVLQEGEIRPLGSEDMHKVDVRIIAATHRNLAQHVEEGLFREDLYYRLSHFPIELPPLRGRDQDIIMLARHFSQKASSLLQRESCQWSEEALQLLAGYRFPGNVRELKSLVERAVLLCEGIELLPDHFNLQASSIGKPPLGLRERMDRLERNVIIECLNRHNGNQGLVAAELGLPRRTLIYRLQRLNINYLELAQ